jgi:hypothetical protein
VTGEATPYHRSTHWPRTRRAAAADIADLPVAQPGDWPSSYYKLCPDRQGTPALEGVVRVEPHGRRGATPAVRFTAFHTDTSTSYRREAIAQLRNWLQYYPASGCRSGWQNILQSPEAVFAEVLRFLDLPRGGRQSSICSMPDNWMMIDRASWSIVLNRNSTTCRGAGSIGTSWPCAERRRSRHTTKAQADETYLTDVPTAPAHDYDKATELLVGRRAVR